MNDPLRIFLAHAHRDEALRKALEMHLAMLLRTGSVTTFDDRSIPPGDEIAPKIAGELERAHLILLLVSADFLASADCGRQVSHAMRRLRVGAVRVLPVIARPCDWQHASFGHLRVTPKHGRPVSTWRSRDAALLDVVRSIRLLHDRWSASHASPATMRPVCSSTGESE